MSSTNEQRLDAALKRFRSHPVISDLREFLLSAPVEELFHIDPTRLARNWNVPRRTVLEVLLRAVRFGILSMEWAFHCPTCGGVAKESLKLAHTHEQDFCPVCKYDFRNTLDENVEVFFSVDPEIQKLPADVKSRYERQIVEDITKGGRHEWQSSGTIKGVEVLNHPVFRDIFGDETLSLDQSLEIRSATVLFSDVTGSTSMYERLGDARAYRLIRDHFDLVFRAIDKHDGVPIKTIGDEVMGVFVDEASAVRAAFDMQDALTSSNDSRSDGETLTLRIGVHRGPVIAVTLNNQIDYFGRTVNIAARTQAVSEPGQLSMGEPFFRAPGVKETLRKRVSQVKRGPVTMKGIDEPIQVYRVTLSQQAGTSKDQ